MSYIVEENCKGKFSILEIKEESTLIIYTTRDMSEANSVCRGLNLGKGFNGETPGFFAEKVVYLNASKLE